MALTSMPLLCSAATAQITAPHVTQTNNALPALDISVSALTTLAWQVALLFSLMELADAISTQFGLLVNANHFKHAESVISLTSTTNAKYVLFSTAMIVLK